MKYLLIIGLCFLIYFLKPIKLDDVEILKPSTISIEVKGHLENPGNFTLKNYSSFNDLLKELELYDDSDYEHISLNKQLYNHDVIVIKEKTEVRKISINSGTKEELMTLKGVGEVMAQRIIDFREQEASFKSIEELMEVKGIGEKVFQNIKDFITL